MAKIAAQKLGALIDKHQAKKAPPKKPGGGPPKPPPSPHAEEEAVHEGEDPKDEQDEHDAGHDKEIAEQQASRVENGNADEDLAAKAADVHPGENGEIEAPEWATDADLWERACKAVEALGDVSEEDHGVIVAHVYEALGGDVGGEENDDEGGDDEGGGDAPDEEDLPDVSDE